MRDIVVVVNIDAKPKPSEALDILLLGTEGEHALKTYRSLDEVKSGWPDKSGAPSKIYKKAEALFEQGKTTLADTLIRKLRIAGVAKPESPAALVASIEALREQDNDWYILLTDQDEPEYIAALAAWAESTQPTEAELGAGAEDYRKLYFAQCADLEKVREIKDARTILIYTDHPEEQADAAYLGNVGPFYPRSVTWKFKRPQGLTLPDLTDAQRDALEENNVNFLTAEYKREYVKNGACANGEFIDVQLGADYIARDMRERLYDVFLANGKIPYTDGGFAQVASAVFAALNRATDLGVVARNPDNGAGEFSVTVPKRAAATDEDARARRMPDIVWEALLEGAVHSTKVTGTLKASLSA